MKSISDIDIQGIDRCSIKSIRKQDGKDCDFFWSGFIGIFNVWSLGIFYILFLSILRFKICFADDCVSPKIVTRPYSKFVALKHL